MQGVYHRAAALFCLAAVYAGFIGILLSGFVRYCICAICAAALLLLLILRRAHVILPGTMLGRIGGVFLSGVLSGMLFFSFYLDLAILPEVRALDGQTMPFSGVVEECVQTSSYGASYAVRLETVGEETNHLQIRLSTADTALTPGDRIAGEATFSAFTRSGNFDEERYHFAQSIYLQADADEVAVLGTAAWNFRQWIERVRVGLAARLRVSLGRTDAALPAALFLGDRSLLSASLSRDFRRLGISHLLAISGLHFTLLLGAAEQLLRAFIPGRRVRSVLLCVLTVAYMFLSGLSESVVRAGVMFLFVYAAEFFSRQKDMPTSLGVAAALICLVSPSAFYSVGFQLSVSAVLALCVLSHVQKCCMRPSRSRLGALVRALATNAIVQLMLLPLVCIYFGEVSLVTPIATVLFSTVVEWVLLLTPLLLLLPGLTPLASLTRLLCDVIEWGTGTFSCLPGITVSLRYALCPSFACVLCASLLLLAIVRTRRQAAVAFCASGVILCAMAGYIAGASAQFAAHDSVISVQTGKNDAMILVSEGRYLICDVSDGSYTAMREACEVAHRYYATEMEGVLLTHLHRRHIRSTDRLCEAYLIRRILLPMPETDTEWEIAHSIEENARKKEIPVVYYDVRVENCIQLGSCTVMMQSRDYLKRSTHPVIAFSVETEAGRVQYLGKSWNETELTPATADVWIFGSHGPVYKQTFACPTSGVVLLRGEAKDFIKGAVDDRVYDGDATRLIRVLE